jgi:hypothetical protein
MTRNLVHPNVMAAVGEEFFPDRVTIQARTVIQDPETGQEIPTYADYAGHTNLPARIGNGQVRQLTGADGETIVTSLSILIRGYFPDIDRNMRAVDQDVREFSIEVIRWDSAKINTTLEVQKLSP